MQYHPKILKVCSFGHLVMSKSDSSLVGPDFKVSSNTIWSITSASSPVWGSICSHSSLGHILTVCSVMRYCIVLVRAPTSCANRADWVCWGGFELKVGKWCQQVWTPQSGTSQIYYYLSLNWAKVNGVCDFGNSTLLLLFSIVKKYITDEKMHFGWMHFIYLIVLHCLLVQSLSP